jgi:predicted Ser/Thr protein kinase
VSDDPSFDRTESLDVTARADSDGAPRFIDEADLAARAIGRFAVLRKIGEGGMGVVYAAFDERLARRVAIKLLHGVDHTRLLREAQALARLSHPHVVQVYEVGEALGRIFVAMEYIEGPTLAAWRTAEPRDAAAILAVYLQAGAGLEAAHAGGLVHRDFKPGNVIVGDDGRARVLDFGLARAGDSMTDGIRPIGAARMLALTSPLTHTGTLLGTPAYMSPEQHAAQPLDARSDQFSFCAALYEALYDERPYAGETLPELTKNLFAGRMRPPRPRPDVPPIVHAAILRGLAADPDRRWPGMFELLRELSFGQRQSVAVGDIRVWRWFAAGVAGLWLAALATPLLYAEGAPRTPAADSAAFSVFGSVAMLSVTPWLRRRFTSPRAHQLIEFSLIYMLASMATRLLLLWADATLLEAMLAETLVIAGMHATLAVSQRISAMYVCVAVLLLAAALTLGLGLSPYTMAVAWLLAVGLDMAIWRWAWPVDR